MSTVADVVVDYQASLRDRSDLFAAAQAASEFYIDRYHKGPPPRCPGNATLSWGLARFGDDQHAVGVRFREQDDAGGFREVMKVLPFSHMLDPVNRDIWMLRLYRDLLGLRSEANLDRIDRGLAELYGEEEGDAATADD